MVQHYKTQLAICIALLVLPGCIFILFNQKEVSYHYKIDIQTYTDQPYTLYVPIPLYTSAPHGSTQPSRILSEITVDGEKNLELTDTIHGEALHIEGTGNASLHAAGNDLYILDTLYKGGTLSLFDSTDLEHRHYWIYYDSPSPSPDEISLRFTYHYRDDQIGSLIEWDYGFSGNLVQGWNSVAVKLSSYMADKTVSSSLKVGGLSFVVITPIAFVYLLFTMHEHKKDAETKETKAD